MKKLLTISLVLLFAGTVLADWLPEDGHKMHFPQMPDSAGWDVDWMQTQIITDSDTGHDVLVTADHLADDWQCSQTGLVTDIHLWVSMRADPSTGYGPVPFSLSNLELKIRSNMQHPEYGYSIPGDILWQGDFFDETLSQHVGVQYYGTGQQGWFDPLAEELEPGTGETPDDHFNYYQINVTGIQGAGHVEPPFEQQAGEIYWLQIEALLVDESGVELGWKTADVGAYPQNPGSPFMDSAVYWYGELDQNINDFLVGEYRPLIIDGQPRDFAFVITPEPATLGLFLIGGLTLLRGRK